MCRIRQDSMIMALARGNVFFYFQGNNRLGSAHHRFPLQILNLTVTINLLITSNKEETLKSQS